jgi:DNA-binding NarL/FixJ family response regulator
MPDTTPINILIANEQAQEAKEAAMSLRAFFPDSRIEVVYSADEAVQWAAKCAWQTILADVELFRQSGLSTLSDLKRQSPMATIIVQAHCNDMTLGTQVLGFGADFYLSKNSHGFLIELPYVLRTFLKTQDLQSRLNAETERVQRLEEQVSRTQTEYHSLTEDLDRVRRELSLLQERVQAKDVELAQTEEKRQLLLDQWEKIRQAHTQVEEEIQQVTGQLSQERGENQALREQMEERRQEHDHLQEKLLQLDEEKQSLVTQLEEARQASTELEEGLQRHHAELSQARNENQAYRDQLELIRNERDHLEEQLSQAQMEKQSLHTQLDHMRLGHVQMEERIKRLEERFIHNQ